MRYKEPSFAAKHAVPTLANITSRAFPVKDHAFDCRGIIHCMIISRAALLWISFPSLKILFQTI
jgi:hypothetical protein